MSTGHRVALIGAGMALPPWLDALSETGCEVVTVATRRTERYELVKQHFPLAKRCWPPEEALGENGATLCLNLSPASRHLEGVRMAASAGLPLILEKPLEVTFDRGVNAIDLARDAGIPLAVCFQYRYQEGALALKEAIDSGRLGSVKSATLDVMWWRGDAYYGDNGRGTYERDGGGVLLTQAIHGLDLLIWYFGLPESVFARLDHGVFHDIETEDVASGLLSYPEGRFATVFATTGARSAEEVKLRVLGSKGTAVLIGNALEIFGDNGTVEQHGESGSIQRISAIDPMGFSSRWHTSFLRDTLEAFEQGNPPPMAGEEALQSLSLIDAMERSARENNQVTPRRVRP